MERTKAEIRAEVELGTKEFLERGGSVTRDARGLGMSHKDWARTLRGEKVATVEEIAAEVERRALLAVRNKDAGLAMDLLRGRYDKEIKFDIENGRLGPNGEIR